MERFIEGNDTAKKVPSSIEKNRATVSLILIVRLQSAVVKIEYKIDTSFSTNRRR